MMNFLKLLLAVLGLMLGVFVVFWVFGLVYSLIWYAFWLAMLGAVGYGGYRLFKKAESKVLGGGSANEISEARDFDLSWDEYQRKYLSK